MRELKNTYDASNKTNPVKIAIYNRNDFKEVERVYYNITTWSFQALQVVLENVFRETIDDFKREIMYITLVSMIFFIIMGRVYWKFELEKPQEEKIYFRQIFRVIPVDIIIQNKFLLNYLKRNSKKEAKLI